MTPEERELHYFEEIHPRLEELTRWICESSGAQSDAARRKLEEFHDEQRRAGHWRPWLTEALADFMKDRAKAAELYRQALEEAKELWEPTQSILISLGATLHELGQTEQAEAFVRDGRAEAQDEGDEFSVEKANRLLRKFADGGSG